MKISIIVFILFLKIELGNVRCQNLKRISKILDIDSIEILDSVIYDKNKKIYILKGIVTTDYCTETNMYIYPLVLNNSKKKISINKFSLPGLQFDCENNLIYESRFFYKGAGNLSRFVWSQRELLQNSKYKESIFELVIKNSNCYSNRIFKQDSIKKILNELKLDNYKELKGEVNYEEP